jgi:hypothetical protein
MIISVGSSSIIGVSSSISIISGISKINIISSISSISMTSSISSIISIGCWGQPYPMGIPIEPMGIAIQILMFGPQHGPPQASSTKLWTVRWCSWPQC